MPRRSGGSSRCRRSAPRRSTWMILGGARSPRSSASRRCATAPPPMRTSLGRSSPTAGGASPAAGIRRGATPASRCPCWGPSRWPMRPPRPPRPASPASPSPPWRSGSAPCARRQGGCSPSSHRTAPARSPSSTMPTPPRRWPRRWPRCAATSPAGSPASLAAAASATKASGRSWPPPPHLRLPNRVLAAKPATAAPATASRP